MEINECVEHMADALSNTQLKEKIIEYVSNHDYGNVREVNKLYELV